MRLTGKIAIVTGGGGGIGSASALLFAEEGAKVAVLDIAADRAGAVADKIVASGGTAIAVAADIANSKDVKRATDQIVAELGLPNILFNNAGLDAEKKVSLLDIDEKAFEDTLVVNVKGTWLMMKYVVPHMIAAGGGSIINVSSVAAFVAASSIGYSAAKGAIVAMTRVAAAEFGRHNIRVNTLAPGVTMTSMAQIHSAEMRARGEPSALDAIDRVSVLGRLAEPIEQARMALFLASDEASFSTGGVFMADGGWTAFGGVRIG